MTKEKGSKIAHQKKCWIINLVTTSIILFPSVALAELVPREALSA